MTDSQLQEPLPLDADEMRQLRKLLKDAEHATWLRKQIFVVVPVVFAVVTGIFTIGSWFITNFTWKR